MAKCSFKTKQRILIFAGMILSPLIILCLILAALCYCCIILPAKGIAYIIFMKKYQRNRQKKYQSKDFQRQDKLKYELQDIMFSFKPIASLNMHLSLSNGFISLINQEKIIMNSKQLQYKFTQGQVENFLYYISLKRIFKFVASNSAQKIPQNYTLNIVYHKGNYYFLMFDFLFILHNLDLQLITQLPDYAYFRNLGNNLNQSAQLFTLNNKLYVHNCSNKLFEVKNNNKLKCVNRKHQNYFYAQFCDKVFALTFNQIFQIKNDLELVSLKQIQSSILLFCSGPILILVTVNDWQSHELFYILNMMDSQVEIKQSKSFQFIVNKQMNYDLLELGENGFKFKDEILDTIFGPEFKTRVSEYEKAYYLKQPKCETKQISKFIFDSKMELIFEPQIRDVNTKLNLLTVTVRDLQFQTNVKINHLLSIQTQVVAKFNGLGYSEYDQ
ncbi:Hypothetical_protein [Hexamita inflata]|uniref:Hypothetical_protein n=1 Tax=Hexamita inflata TaxID=28002 RepID=A0AA86P7J4_9EUKA|nr:Hypothetical protein HINF_LOCUS20705 [Hexamita inflata]